MKRLILIALLAAVGTTQAQYVVDKGNEDRHIDPEDFAQASYAGMYQGSTLWVCPARNGWIVEGYDHHMQQTLSASLRYPGTEILAATNHEGAVTMLMADRSSSKRTDVLLTRCTPLGEWTIDTVATYAHAKKDRCLLWASTSPSGNLMGLCAIVEYTEKHQYSAFMTLYTAAGERLWQREFALGSMDQLYVTDDGRLVSLGYEQDGTKLTLVINYADREHAETLEATVNCETVRDLQIANVIDSRMIALGTICGTGFRGAEKYYGGVISLAFDLDSAVINNFNIQPFRNEDVDIFYNKPTKKMQRELVAEHITTIGTVRLPYGGAIAIGRNYEKVDLADNGTEMHSFERIGIHIVAADRDGNIAWSRNLRRNDKQKKSAELLGLGLAAMGDTLCVIKSENRKYPAIYDIAKDAKQLKVGDKSNIVLYTIAPDGTVEKNILEAKSKYTFLRLVPTTDRPLHIITARGNHLREVTLNRQ